MPEVTFKEGINNAMANINDYKDAPVWTPEKIKDATHAWFHYYK